MSRIGGAEGFNIDNVGDMSQIGQTGNPKNAYDVGIEIGTYLKELGFNVDFAPVADVVDDNENNVMLSRSFGSAPTAVGKFVKSEIEGILSTGVLCCAKHFPGIGTAEGGDSHENTILSYKSESDMMSTDIVPFISAIQANVPFIMVGHLTTPAITGNELPASLNSTIMVDILRNQLGYQGVIITDSLEMAAVEDVFSPYEIGVKVLEAGADMILMPSDFDTTYQGVVDAVNNGTLSENRIDDSVKRILTAKLSAGL